VWGKQTLAQLSTTHDLSIKTIHKLLKTHVFPKTLPYLQIPAQSIYLVIDAYYRKRGDGTIIFRAVNLQVNLLWRDIGSETIADYLWGVELLEAAGYKILGIIIDGRRGVSKALESHAPVQYCQFHQIKTATKYLTKKPKTEAGQSLRRIALAITEIDQELYDRLLARWHFHYGKLIKEKTKHPLGGWSYTHKSIRSCYYSLVHNSSHLFTCMEHPFMSNTTNSLDGSISHLRTLHRIHRGIRLNGRLNFTEGVLRGKTTIFYQ
jgi:hypothetical protein